MARNAWWLAAGVAAAGVAAAGVTIARAMNRRLARAATSATPAHPIGAGGVIVGAEPIRLEAGTDREVLLLHGFNDTPQSVAELARALHGRGWSVSVPLLPQHGRTATVLEREGSADAWMECARTEWAATRARASRAVLGGQSMGGALAVIMAAEHAPAAMVLLAPYLTMGGLTRLLARAWPLWQLATPHLFSDSKKGVHDAAARARSLGGGVFTPRLVAQLLRVVVAARRALPTVRAPALVLHGRRDYRIRSRDAIRSFERLGSLDKTLIWRDRGGHVLAADEGRDEVFTLVGEWLEERVPPGTSDQPGWAARH